MSAIERAWARAWWRLTYGGGVLRRAGRRMRRWWRCNVAGHGCANVARHPDIDVIGTRLFDGEWYCGPCAARMDLEAPWRDDR